MGRDFQYLPVWTSINLSMKTPEERILPLPPVVLPLLAKVVFVIVHMLGVHGVTPLSIVGIDVVDEIIYK